MLNFNRVLIHSLYICICAKIRCHTKHHYTPSKIWLQHLSQTGHYMYCFSFRPAQQNFIYQAHFIVDKLNLHSVETDNRLISVGILDNVLFNLSYWCTVCLLHYPRELSPTRERDNKLKNLNLDLKILSLYSHLFFGGWSLTFIRSSPSLMRWPKFTSWISWREKNASETNTQRLKWSKLLLDLVISETDKGLKHVTLIYLLCLMLVNIHFRKHHIYLEREEKIDLTDKTWQLQKHNLKSEFHCFKLNTLISSCSLCQMLANLKKRKRKSLSHVLTFHKTWNKAVSHCSLAVTAKKCTKKCDAHAKLLINLLFRGPSEDFQINYGLEKNIHEHWTWVTHLNLLWVSGVLASPVLPAKMSTNFSNFLVSDFFYNEYMYLPLHCLSYQQNIKGKKKNAILILMYTTQLFYE